MTDSRNKRDGRYIERLGFFNPIANADEVELELDRARVEFWLSKGARPSDRVEKLIRQDRLRTAEKTAA